MKIWAVGFGVLTVALAALIGYDVSQYLSDGMAKSDIGNRALVAFLITTEFPLIAAIVGCTMNSVFSWRCSVPQQASDPELDPQQVLAEA